MSTKHHTHATAMSRRSFARLAGLAGAVGWLELPAWAALQTPPLSAAPAAADEAYWQRVRQQFLMPPGLAIVNAANLCPTSLPVVEAVYRATRDVDADPSMPNRRKLSEATEQARRTVAAALRATPEEIVITRNTSEGNNFVSSGIDLKAGDEVLVSAENHPSLLSAWDEKAKQFGFTVRRVAHPNPYPGHAAIVEAFRAAFTPATRVVAFTHVTASVGDVFLCPGASRSHNGRYVNLTRGERAETPLMLPIVPDDDEYRAVAGAVSGPLHLLDGTRHQCGGGVAGGNGPYVGAERACVNPVMCRRSPNAVEHVLPVGRPRMMPSGMPRWSRRRTRDVPP